MGKNSRKSFIKLYKRKNITNYRGEYWKYFPQKKRVWQKRTAKIQGSYSAVPIFYNNGIKSGII